MKRKLFLFLLAIQLAFSSPLHAQTNAGYRVGDRLVQPKAPDATADYKKIEWEDLMPKNWDPNKEFKDMNLSKLNDGDPRAMDLLRRMREAWENAPIEPSWNGKRIRIPGFIVPLETQNGKVMEFLLVPYFGACIHTPPPPSNQTIHVFLSKPAKDAQMMAAVWISGTLQIGGSKTVLGNAGYKMKADEVKAYN